MDLKEPIKFRFAFETMRADSEGECLVTLRLPATEFPKAARLAIMREIEFEGTCVPVDVKAPSALEKM